MPQPGKQQVVFNNYTKTLSCFQPPALRLVSKAENVSTGSLQVPQKTFPSFLSTHIMCFAIYCYIHFLKGKLSFNCNFLAGKDLYLCKQFEKI